MVSENTEPPPIPQPLHPPQRKQENPPKAGRRCLEAQLSGDLGGHGPSAAHLRRADPPAAGERAEPRPLCGGLRGFRGVSLSSKGLLEQEAQRKRKQAMVGVLRS